MPLVKRWVLILLVVIRGMEYQLSTYMSGNASLYLSTVRTFENPVGLYSL